MTGGTDAEGGGRLDRPLGRGLEDISHLFQSGRRSEAIANEPRSGGSPHDVATSSSPGAVLLGRRMSLTRDQFAPLLKQFHGALEEGLTSIDSEIACPPPYGQIDLLGLSRSNQLTIIDFNTNADDGLLVRGIGQVDWVTRNLPIIRRLYPSHTINYSLPPALLLVAPRFSAALRSVARQVLCPTIKWIRYCALESPVGLAISFERVEGD